MFHALFEARVERAPDALALVSGDLRLTYAELNRRANRVAHHLRGLGVGPEVRVGLCVDRSPELAVGLLGVLKAGGAYVPLDPGYPPARLAFMLEDARLPVLLTLRDLEPSLPEHRARVVRLDGDRERLEREPGGNPDRLGHEDNLAYVIYTSGSTGRPKGALVQHRGLMNLALSLARLEPLELRPGCRVLQLASPSFDASLWELALAWGSGGELHLAPAEARLPGPELVRLLRERAITHLCLPPSALAALPEAELPELRVLVAAGEPCPPALVDRWGRGRRFLNAYGPTEATICTTLQECTPGDPIVPIGRPIAGARVRLLDAQLRPVPDGAPGELYIAGPGLARGYLGRPELTAERFLPDPASGERLYRTGDLARALPDGRLEHLGRVDHQVKVRGFRVEPGEIEAALAEHPRVREAVVAAREDAAGERQLVAWLLLRPGAPVGVSEWRRFLRERLPEHLVPSAFVLPQALPRLPNGKVDRAALPSPGAARPALATAWRAPETPLERALEGIWQEVLQVAPIGADDDFFELGGSSLRATSVLARLRETFAVELPPLALFEAPTLAELAARVEASRRTDAAPPLQPTSRAGPLPLSFAQQRLWFLHQLEPGSAAYNLCVLVRLEGPLDPAALARSLEALVRRHEALRTTFGLTEAGPVQRIAPPGPIALPLEELEVPEAEREAKLAELGRQELTRPFDLDRGPRLRARLLSLGGEHTLLLGMHHLAADGWSLGVLIRELAALYDAAVAGRPEPLAPLPVQYADFASWQRRWMRGKALERPLAYWTRELEDAPRTLALPTDAPRSRLGSSRGAQLAFRISSDTGRALQALGRAQGASRFMVLFAAFNALLHRWTGQEDLVVGTPVANRSRRELEGLVGFFANTLALRTRVGGDPGFRELLGRVRERTLAAYAHQELPLELLVAALGPEREAGQQPLFQVMFALEEALPDVRTRSGLRLRALDAEAAAAPFDLGMNVREGPEHHLEGTVVYRADLFQPATVARLVHDFQALLDEVAAHPDRPLSRLERPGRRDRPGDGALAAVEEALLADPAIADCAVRLRWTRESGLARVAYVVEAWPRAGGELHLAAGAAVEAVVPIRAMPLTPEGRVDEDALRRVPVLDGALARGCEERLRSSPGVADAAVIFEEEGGRAPPLHLADLLPGWRPGPAAGAPAPVSTKAPRPSGPARPLAPAFSDGGPLVIPEGEPRTLTAALLRAASRFPDRGITYVEGGDTTHQGYAGLLEEARRVLAGLNAEGLGPGSRVILQLDARSDHLAAFWGCLLAGVTPTTVAAIPAHDPRGGVARKLLGAWELLGRPVVLASRSLVPSLLGLGANGLRVLELEALRARPPAERLHEPRPGDVAFLQLSSGSTGAPKCIQETHEGLIRHIHGARQLNGYTPEDVSLNWLPVDHVGALVTYHLKDVYVGCAQVQERTESVLAEPLRWLELIERYRVTHTWAPNFGYRRVCDALRAHPGRTLELSSMKRFASAGEQVTFPVVSEFLRLTAPFGVRPGTLQPAFGMAETSTGICYRNDFDLDAGVHHVSRDSLGGALELRPSPDASTLSFVELGPPIPGVQLRVVDPEGRLLPEATIGRVQVRGGVLTPGYLGDEAANREAFVGEGWFNTGDLGFLLGGRLTMTGREKETIVIRGAHVFCHEVEERVSAVEGVEPTFAAACGVPDPRLGTEELAIFFVPRERDRADRARIAAELRARLTAELGLAPGWVVPLEREELPKTTSGKLQRAALREALLAGRFEERLKQLDLEEGNANTLPRWFHRRSWRRRELAGPELPGAAEGCLVFADRHGLGERIRAALEGRSRRCVSVEPGADFARLASDRYRLRPDDPEHYRRLLAELAPGGGPVREVLHLWTYGEPPARGRDEAPSEERQRLGAYSLLFLAQALARGERAAGPTRLRVVSSHAQPTSPEEPVVCEHALVLGLARTLPRELPWLDCRHLDLPPGDPGEDARLVLRELREGRCEPEVVWRRGRRLVPRLEEVAPVPAGAQAPPFTGGGVYLVTGGLGTLGREVARHLLRRHRARLLLVGRTPLDGAETGRAQAHRELVELAARTGGDVGYEAVDVCEPEALRRAVETAEARWARPLDGVLHLAGVLARRELLDESAASFAGTLRPKVLGTWALDRLVAQRPGARFIAFSSVLGFFGGPAAGAYSAASRFQEHFEHERRREGRLGGHCFSWGRWEAGGPSPLVAPRGVASLEVGLAGGHGQLLIGLEGTSPEVLRHLDRAEPGGRRAIGCFAAAPGAGVEPQALPFEVYDRFGTPVRCHPRRVERIPRLSSGEVDAAALRALAAGPTGARREPAPPRGQLEGRLAGLWREVLGRDIPGVLDSFFELGGHSMLLAQLRVRMEACFSREVPLIELFHHPTIRAQAAWLGEASPSAPREGAGERARKQRAALERHRQRAAANLQPTRSDDAQSGEP